ncbi:hypothetical protein [Bdellovibrio sp. HCB288]|uniref:hypothetical protein n=1 Tax=Bdellovibrio sp. HCB288 TaxID=3394355 RepID=UPI0039B6205D
MNSVLLALLLGLGTKGVVNGGGGKGVRCGNRVQLMDLYEGQLVGYPMPATTGNFDADLKMYLPKVVRQMAAPGSNVDDPSSIDSQIKAVYGMLGKVIDLPRGEKLQFTNDATLPALPHGCQFVQVAVNVVEEVNGKYEIKVYRDRELWDMMAPVDQVGLVYHEWIYWMTRVVGDAPKSDDTRYMIAKLFSGLETFESFTPIWNKSQIVQCFFFKSGARYQMQSFYAASEIENGVEGTGVYFHILDGQYLISRTRTFIPGITPDSLLKSDQLKSVTAVSSPLFHRGWTMEYNVNSRLQQHSLRITPAGQQPTGSFAVGSCESK